MTTSLLLALQYASIIFHAEAIGASSSSSTIPRTTHHRTTFSDPDASSVTTSSPPWMPSSQIDDDGFLKSRYTLLPGEWEAEANIGGRHGPNSRRYKTLHRVPVTIRQVPGDGNCLFHSIATCLSYAVNGTHVCMRDTSGLFSVSRYLRKAAVDCLSCNPYRRLFLQGTEYLRAGELVSAAAAQYDLSGEEYCEQMRQESYWGGGPEIVALSNVLKRPIHVYELCSDIHPDPDDDEEELSHRRGGSGKQQLRGTGSENSASTIALPTSSQFRLRRMACFGSPRFDRREPLHILSADSRFPDVQPGRQVGTGNHFLALFPDPLGEVTSALIGKKPRRVRGGGGGDGPGKAIRRKKDDIDVAAGAGKKKKKKSRATDATDDFTDLDEEDGIPIWERFASRMSRLMDW